MHLVYDDDYEYDNDFDDYDRDSDNLNLTGICYIDQISSAELHYYSSFQGYPTCL